MVVAKNAQEPSPKIGTWQKLRMSLKRASTCFLDEILRVGRALTQFPGV